MKLWTAMLLRYLNYKKGAIEAKSEHKFLYYALRI